MTTATDAGGKRRAKKIPTMGPVRTNLEAFGVAILAAVLLKWFCIEAYQIPTSSMQPTLMGDVNAGVYDRILVDKLVQTIREPQRWDITVFAYPLQKNQSYVKRIVGMPNDRLHIAGGNIYQVAEAEGRRTYRVERKPADLQELLWKDVFPGRMHTRSEGKVLGNLWTGSPGRTFTEDADGLVATLDGTARLSFRDETDGGFIDRVWDGYPAETARAIREPLMAPGMDDRASQEIVPDARLRAVFTPEKALDELSLEIEVRRPGFDAWTFAFALRGGKGSLQVRKETQVLGQSPEFAVEMPAGESIELGFAHVDDELVAWRDGVELQRFDTAAWACREGCVVPAEVKDGRRVQPDNQRVEPRLSFKGKGKVRIDDLRLDRDLHYTRWDAPEVIEVPDGHYYMMGDNTQQSIDSRGWTAITVGVDAEDRIVPPDTPGARIVRGNKRAMPLERAPDRDETPIAIPSEDAVVMIDEYGEILRLRAKIGTGWGNRVVFRKPGEDGAEWVPPDATNARGISFVPRGDIRGRALLVFYPSRPLAWLTGNKWPDRFGFVR